jgi:hypothetical protein
MKELDACGDCGATTLFAHEVKHFTPQECLQLLVRACPPHTYGGLHKHHELQMILGDGPDPLHHLGYLPLAVRTFVEWASEQFLRYMQFQTPERVQEMVAHWLRVCDQRATGYAPCDTCCRWDKTKLSVATNRSIAKAWL